MVCVGEGGGTTCLPCRVLVPKRLDISYTWPPKQELYVCDGGGGSSYQDLCVQGACTSQAGHLGPLTAHAGARDLPHRPHALRQVVGK